MTTKRSPFRSALAAAFGTKTAPADALQEARGDIATATAIRLGVPVANRPAVDDRDVHQLVGRAARRAALRKSDPTLWRSDVKSSYSRRLTRKATTS